MFCNSSFNPLNTELHPTCHLLALLGAHHILHISRISINCTVYSAPVHPSTAEV